MTVKVTSHEYAQKLRAIADALEARPAFNLPGYSDVCFTDNGIDNLRYYDDKKGFLAAVRAIGNGRKTVNDRSYTVVAIDGLLHISADRDAVCRIVKPAVPAEYECEPLLTPEEEAALA